MRIQISDMLDSFSPSAPWLRLGEAKLVLIGKLLGDEPVVGTRRYGVL